MTTSSSSPRPRITRPVRRVRRWARHTPNGTIALNLICVGVVLLLVAALLVVLL